MPVPTHINFKAHVSPLPRPSVLDLLTDGPGLAGWYPGVAEVSRRPGEHPTIGGYDVAFDDGAVGRLTIDDSEPGEVRIHWVRPGLEVDDLFTLAPDLQGGTFLVHETRWSPQGVSAWFRRRSARAFRAHLDRVAPALRSTLGAAEPALV